MTLTYEHCGVMWKCSEKHFGGDVCFNCGTNAVPVQMEIIEPESEEASCDDIP